MTDLALSTAYEPQVPSVMVQLLEKLAVPYRARPSHSSDRAAQRVQAVLLNDPVGALLVLYPHSQLLDLSRLKELTGRSLHAISQEQLAHMLNQHQLSHLPALPALTSSPCLYDERLLQEPVLLIDSGQTGLVLEIEQAHYRKLLSKASSARFGEPLKGITPNLDRPNEDRNEIHRAVQAFTTRRIQQRLEETIEIPPLAETAHRIVKLRVDPEATIDDITGVVETDPALAAQVISWATSPYYAAPGKIRSVEDAIVRVLGFDLVLNLALGLALGKTLDLPKDRPQHSTPYWQQAIYCAALIEGLARAIPREQRPEMGLSYLAGLLHNFGYLVLAHVFPPHFSLICRHMEVNPHLSHSSIEQHLLGISREQIGAWLMQHWDMPEELAVALRFQHDPNYAGEQCVYPNLVCLAQNLLRSQGLGQGPQQELPEQLYARLGLSREQAQDALDNVLQAEVALRELATLFSARR